MLFRSGILNEQVERLTEVMESISHCCGVDEIKDSQSGETKTKRRKIYESTLDKAKDLCNTFKAFKPVNNEVSNKLAIAVAGLESSLSGVDSDLIRENDMVRDRVKNDVDDILSKFKL